ncbi:hypothetical protein D3C86_1909330 [compost metagenome]
MISDAPVSIRPRETTRGQGRPGASNGSSRLSVGLIQAEAMMIRPMTTEAMKLLTTVSTTGEPSASLTPPNM